MIILPEIRRVGANGETTVLTSKKNDPNLPSYIDSDVAAVQPFLEISNDVFEGQSQWIIGNQITNATKAARYLPKEEKERQKSYISRIQRSTLINFYKPAIKGFAGLLTDFTLTDSVPDDIRLNDRDIDMRGSSLKAFAYKCDTLVLRDGFCGILVNFPEMPKNEDGSPVIQDAKTESQFNRRPWLEKINRSQICNGELDDRSTDLQKGILRFQRLTVKHVEATPDGKFGKRKRTVYHSWFPGGYDRWVENDKREPVFESTVYISLPIIPIVVYLLTDIEADDNNDAVTAIRPPLYDLACLNIAHYRQYSDYIEVLHRCNLPVPVRVGFIQPGVTDVSTLPPIILGPNSAIDVPKGGNFFFAEPSGAAINATRQALQDLEAAILRETLNFFGSNSTQQTLGEADMRSAQTRASLSLMAEMKESAFEQVFELWMQWLNRPGEGGTISVNKNLLSSPLTPQTIQALNALVARHNLDIETFLNILKTGKVIPKDIEVADVIDRLKSTPITPEVMTSAI